MWIDSHCHLSDEGLAPKAAELATNMQANQVDAALVVCTTLEGFEPVKALAHSQTNWFATIGVHPDEKDCTESSIDDLIAGVKQSAKVLAIGETGLDYYWNKGERDSLKWQRDRFATHIQAAIACDKPLVVHTRSASADTIAMLQSENAHLCGGVIHCFTETWDVAKAALDLGFYISFSGIVTFKNAHELREVALKVPSDRILIETDSPYLAPMPHRGKTNEPAYVKHVGQFLAQLRGESEANFALQTSNNFWTLFDKQGHFHANT